MRVFLHSSAGKELISHLDSWLQIDSFIMGRSFKKRGQYHEIMTFQITDVGFLDAGDLLNYLRLKFVVLCREITFILMQFYYTIQICNEPK